MLEQLLEWLRVHVPQGACLAYSGGVDSAVLLKAAVLAGIPVRAVTFHTFLHPNSDLVYAKELAGEIGAVHEVITINELTNQKILSNPPDRCYHCKHQLFSALLAYSKQHGFSAIMDGTNEDDLHEYRPGLRALQELGVLSPLAALGFTKEQVRALAKQMGLRVYSKPSTPCMATRLPYGDLITQEKLSMIERAEDSLKQLGFAVVRARLHGEVMRIEVDKEQLLCAVEQSAQIVAALKACGVRYVTLDLEGFRSGSFDCVTPKKQKTISR